MKRKLACIILVAMVFNLVACGKKADSSATTPVTDVATEVASEVASEVTSETGQDDATTESAADSGADAASGDTVGAILANEFLKQMESGASVEDAVNSMASLSGFDCATMDCQEGYLNGFSDEVKGFDSATMFSPYIGSIPFVAYVFETEDPEALLSTLDSLADPRWNVCTEAEETVSEVYDKYVFYAMLPGADFEAE